MSEDKFKMTIHMVSSLDGFVAKKDGSVSWLQSTDTYENGIVLGKEDIDEFLKSIDCYVMGSKTYEHALELGWPYGEVPVIVMTNRDLNSDRDSVEFYSDGMENLVDDRLKSNYKNVWIVGGPTLARDFIRKKLVDEIIVSIMPIILGDGKLFFDYIGQEQQLHLKDTKAYKDGMVELWYEVKKS